MTPTGLERVLDDCVNPECLGRIHEALAQLWTEAGDVVDIDRTMFEIAVIEVAGNVVQHNGRGPGFDCRITIRISDATLVAQFCDTGVNADVDLEAATLPDEESEHGRGLAMARAAADELTYERIDGRNSWLITRRRTAVE